MDKTPEKETLLTFPCDFNIKIIGNHTTSFTTDVLEIIRKHFPTTEDAHIQKRVSQEGRFLAITVKLYVENKLTLDALYLELSQHPEMKWVL